MGELIILLIGAFLSGIMALLKLATIISVGWLVVAIPIIVALAILGLMSGDGFDFDFS